MPYRPLHRQQHLQPFVTEEAQHLQPMQLQEAERFLLMRGAVVSLETYREEVYHRQPIPPTRLL